MYFLYYNKKTNLMIDIKNEKENNSEFNYMSITKEKANEIMEKRNNNYFVKVKNRSIDYIYNNSEFEKKLFDELNYYYNTIDNYFLLRDAKGVSEVEKFKKELQQLSQNYFDFEDKKNFKYLITKNVSNKNYNVVVLVPSQIGEYNNGQ